MTPSPSKPRQSHRGTSPSASTSVQVLFPSSTSTDKMAPTASPSSSASSRLNQVASHLKPIMSSPPAPSSFPADLVPQAPEDPLFGLAREYRADESPYKVDLVSSSAPLLPS